MFFKRIIALFLDRIFEKSSEEIATSLSRATTFFRMTLNRKTHHI